MNDLLEKEICKMCYGTMYYLHRAEPLLVHILLSLKSGCSSLANANMNLYLLVYEYTRLIDRTHKDPKT